MAFLAGGTDICGYFRLHYLFVSFMSGNTTILAFALGHGNMARVGTAAGLVGLFVGGAVLGTILAVFCGRRHVSVVTFAVAILLLAAASSATVTVPLLALAMGALNSAMHRAGAAGVSLTYVTGALVKFAQGLGHVLSGRASDPNWRLQGVLWMALLLGAVTATLELRWLPGDVLFWLAFLALMIAGASALWPGQAS